jgi:hypothetical protein
LYNSQRGGTLTDAARLSRFLATCFYHAALDLHDSVLAALADVYIHDGGGMPLALAAEAGTGVGKGPGLAAGALPEAAAGGAGSVAE